MIKRIFSLLLTVSMLAGFLAFPVSAKVKDENVAFAVMGEELKTQNFEKFFVGTKTDKKQISTRNERECWILDKVNGVASSKLCMNLSPSFKRGVNDGDAFIVEVDYFDASEGGFFFLGYDGQRPRQLNEEYIQAGDVIYTEGTEIWKTATFRIDDAKFDEGLEGGCDLYISTARPDSTTDPYYLSLSPIPFAEVRITKVPKANPVRNVVKIDNVGNTFKWFSEEKTVHNTFTNLKDEKISVDITYELETPSGYIAHSVTQKVDFEAKETKQLDFNFGDFKRCDRYNYFVTVKNDELGINSRVQYSVVVILKTDPDGIKNEIMNISDMGYRDSTVTPREHLPMGMELTRMGNFNGIRYDEGLGSRVLTLNEFRTDTVKDEIVEGACDAGLEFLPILYMSGWAITGGWNYFPDTEAEFEIGAEAIGKTVQLLADRTDTYEAWNEPDIKYFAQNYSVEGYYKIASLMHDAVRKYDPDAKLGFLCYAAPASQWIRDDTAKMFEWGLADLVKGDAITFHGYPKPNPEEWRSVEDRIGWYVDKMTEYGVDRSEYELWYTEYGGTVADAHIGTRRRQGAVTVRETLLARLNMGVEKFWIHRFDDPGSILFQREASFGMVSEPTGNARVWGQILVPWESYVMMTGYNYLFAQSEPVGKLLDEKNLKVYEFYSNKFNKDIITLNTVRNTEKVTLDLGVNEISYFDEYANETKLTSKDGIYTFSVTEYPCYIMGDFNDVKALENADKFIMNTSEKIVSSDIGMYEIVNNYGKDVTLLIDGPVDVTCVLKPGKNIVEIPNSKAVGEFYEIALNIFDGEKQIARLPIEVTSIKKADMEMIASPRTLSKWDGTVRIKNNSSKEVLKGKFEITSPESMKLSTPVEVSYIPKGKVGKISFSLPEISQKQIYSIEYKLTLDSGQVLEDSVKMDTTCAAYTNVKPVIDGEMSPGEWNLQTLMETASIENIAYNTGWFGKEWAGPIDQSAKAYAMWDEENVYFCWDVTDDKFSQEYEGSDTWNGDSVQVGMYKGGSDEYIAFGEANAAFTEIGIAKTKNGVEAYRFSSQDSDSGKIGLLNENQCKAAITVNGNHTIYEMSMPWSELVPGSKPPKQGERLGFSFLVNENDGNGRQGAIMFARGIFHSKDASLFTYLNLAG